MNTARLSLPVLLTFFWYSFLGAQGMAHIPGEILVSLPAGTRPESLIQRYRDAEGEGLSVVRPVSTLMNVWLLHTEVPFNNLKDKKALDWLRKQDLKTVRFAQYNQILQSREEPEDCLNTLPDDPLFPLQWQYINTGANNGLFDADLDADQAWDITTGGITPAGDTIVVAVIDGGLSYNHPDLAGNIWRNWAEIPGDGIDNDNNSYVDDFRGWNVVSGNDQIEGTSTLHGTPVSSIIGAKGNNGIGVSGVNWNVKILFVSGSGTVDNILSAFDYVRETRKRYNDTHGASGAFVVAVNCSWGIDYGQPADQPLWCAAFDELGAEGILSIAATANNPVNVDEVGDLPTTCSSDYLISVTSLNKADQKAPNAAWGPENIDLGAYGHAVYTAGAGNSYGIFEGTSFAAPQVSGAVALLYSSPCPGLIALAKTQPAEAALWAKSLILEGVTSTPSMEGITLTGGRLNLYNTLQSYEDQCNPCPAPFALVATDITDTTALLEWVEAPDFQSVELRWRKLGDSIWVAVGTTSMPFLLSGLSPCSNYEFALAAQCDQGLVSAWSDPFFFKTNGCCTAPDLIWASLITDTGVNLQWNPVNTAQKYRLRIRNSGESWQYYVVANNLFSQNDLTPCTSYEVQVQTICPGGLTAFSNSFFFASTGCGVCTEGAYCAAGAQNANAEWINQLQIGSWLLSASGIPGNGYLNFTNEQPVTPVFHPMQSYPLSLTPGFSGSSNKQYVRIYIDFNGDGIFGIDELAYDPGFSQEGTISGQVVIPQTIVQGNTRMRVIMKATNNASAAPQPCENFMFGQVEDFCVELEQIADVTNAPGSDNPQQLRLWPRPAKDLINIAFLNPVDAPARLIFWDMSGRMILSQEMQLPGTIDIKDWPSGIYGLEVWSGGVLYTGLVLK